MRIFLQAFITSAIAVLALSYTIFTSVLSPVQQEEIADAKTFASMATKECERPAGRCAQDKAAIAKLRASSAWDDYINHPFLTASAAELYFVNPADYFHAKSVILSPLRFDRTSGVIDNDVETALKPLMRLQDVVQLICAVVLLTLGLWFASFVTSRIKKNKQRKVSSNKKAQC
jgi:hypothetical protein